VANKHYICYLLVMDITDITFVCCTKLYVLLCQRLI